jgi:hypothetical protein
MTGIQYLRSLHEVCCFQSTGGARTGPASNSELGRWLKDKVLQINGKSVGPKDEIEFPITSVVLFPNARKRRCTLL